MADENAGLRVIDVSNPASPSEVGFYDTPYYAYGVAISGGYAYVANGASGLRVIDVSNPASPSEVGSCETVSCAEGVVVAGDFAYLAAHQSGLRVIDVSNPAAPVEVGYYRTPDWATGVAVSGAHAYLANHNCGLSILRFTGPATLQVNAVGNPSSLSVLIKASPLDSNGDGNGTAPFTRTYQYYTEVTLTAPQLVRKRSQFYLFNHWEVNGATSQNLAITFPMDGHETATAHYSDITPPTVTIDSVSPNPFSPNNDGSEDTTTVSYSINEATTVYVVVLNEAGTEAVKVLVGGGSQVAGTHQTVWDGADTDGSTVANGSYWMVVLAKDAAGNWGCACHPVVVNNQGGLTVSAYPTTFSPNSDGIDDTTTIVYSLDYAATATYLVVLNGDGTEIVKALVLGDSKERGAYTAVWDGTNTQGNVVPDGNYWIAWLAKDAGGTWRVALCQVTVDTS